MVRNDMRAVDDNDYRLVAELHAQGLGRNEIARQIQRGPRTVSVIAANLNLTFDRTLTEEATRARKADLEERRVILAEALQSDAERLTEQLWEPAKVFNIGGSANSYTEHEVDEPPADAKKNLMASAGIAIEKSLKLVPLETDTESLDTARSMLGALADGVRKIVNSGTDEDSSLE